ncbi:MAG: hypothetical protein SNI18_06315 [Rikenellaceae bacterium]
MKKTIHERIKTLVGVFGSNKNTVFANRIGVSEGNVRGYVKNVMPKADVLEKIVRTCDISAMWLLTGEGDMIVENQIQMPIIEYRSDPRDADLIVANKETIETQRKLIASLESRISELEKSSRSKRGSTGLHSALTVDSHSTDYSGNETK